MKKFLSLLLAAALAMSAAPVQARAEAEETPAGVIASETEQSPSLPEVEQTEAGTEAADSPAETEEKTQESEEETIAEIPEETTEETTEETEAQSSQETVCGTDCEMVPEAPAAAEKKAENTAVSFVLQPAELRLTVYTLENGAKQELLPEPDGNYLLQPGTYFYDAACEGFRTVTGAELKVTEEMEPVAVVLEKAVPETAAVPEETNTEPTEPEMIFEEQSVSMNDVLEDNEELLEGYVQEIFYAGDKARIASTGGRDSMNAKEMEIYKRLENLVVAVAQGNRFRTKIDNLYITFTTGDLGISDLWNGNRITETAKEKIFEHFKNALFAVIEDHPYECFWISKSVNMEYGFGYSITGGNSVKLKYYYELPVASHYAKQGGEREDHGRFYVEIDPSATSATSTARKASEYAREIVAEHAGLNDWDKLYAYKNVICDLVEYDHGAVSTGPNDANGSTPWQLINVFDKNPKTNVVCEGYSKAFQYLCELSTFQGEVICYQDHGDTYFRSGGGGPHMWNIVKIEGKMLLVDVTNSEPGSIGQDGSLFLVPARKISNGFDAGGNRYYKGKYMPSAEAPDRSLKSVSLTFPTPRKGEKITTYIDHPDYEAFIYWDPMTKEMEKTGLFDANRPYDAYIQVVPKGREFAAQVEFAANDLQDTFVPDEDGSLYVIVSYEAYRSKIFRLYNPYSGEHLLSSNEAEVKNLTGIGWKLDGIAWYAVEEGTPVYRLYNPYDGSHLYTVNQAEINQCLKVGWKMDGQVSSSASSENGTPIYRLFNPYVKAHYHLFTINQEEIKMLTAAGWKLEGVAWYADK